MAHLAKLLIRDVVTVAETDSVRAASRKMKAAGVGCVVVAKGRTPSGIFTERDLLNRVVAEGLDPDKTQVSKVMTAKPVTIDSSEPLDRVFSALAQRRFRHIPITEGGSLVGIVSLSDLAKVLESVYREDKYIQYFADYVVQEGKAGR